MIRFFSLAWFHLKIYAKNSYFINLMITSTLSMFFLDYIAQSALGADLSQIIWIRASIFGLWASGTTAAGSIGFQRFQGTLLYLINTAYNDQLSLTALIAPAASFGLLSFPLAILAAFIFQVPVRIQGSFILAGLALWLGALVLDLLIASVFVLTKNAIVYEDLLTLPLLFLSGLFPLPGFLQSIQPLVNWLLPIALPIQWLLGFEALSAFTVFQFIVCLALSLVLSINISKYILKQARVSGKLGGVLWKLSFHLLMF